jgi:transcription antitermination protein NusB
MSARSKARKRALDMIYGADVRGEGLRSVLDAETLRAAREPSRAGSWGYAREIAEGVLEHSTEIDETIESYAHGWSLSRMPAVDRAILRMGVWELRFNPEVPDSVAIAEAVELAGSLSTEESSGFVNGVLGKIAATPAS